MDVGAEHPRDGRADYNRRGDRQATVTSGSTTETHLHDSQPHQRHGIHGAGDCDPPTITGARSGTLTARRMRRR